MMQACGEDGPKSVADKFSELESKLETALRECLSAGITIDNLEAKCAVLAAELRAERLRQNANSVMLQCANDSLAHDGKNHPEDKLGMVDHFGGSNNMVEPVTDNTNQQFESLSRGGK